MVHGNRMGDPGKDDYLLRYQVGITLVGCSTESAQSQGQGIQEGKQVVERRQKAFLSCEASSGVDTWATVAIGSEYIYTGMYMVYGLLGTIQVRNSKKGKVGKDKGP